MRENSWFFLDVRKLVNEATTSVNVAGFPMPFKVGKAMRVDGGKAGDTRVRRYDDETEILKLWGLHGITHK